jgi:diguanylate cyclase (GGDEF)-like protein
MMGTLVLGWITRSIARRVAVYAAAAAAVAATTVGAAVMLGFMRDEPSHARTAMLLTAVAGGAATVLCVAIVTVLIVNRLLSGPLGELTRVLRQAESGRWLKTTKSTRADEIGDVARAFDRLSATVTDLSVAVIDSDRELAYTRRELKLKEALSLLFELTQTLNAESDLDGILSALPGRIGKALGFEQMAVLLFDEARQEFVVRGTYGIAAAARDVAFPRDDLLSGAVADSGQPLVIPDTARDPRYSHFKGQHLMDGAFACVPMLAGKRLVGLFHVLRPGAASITDPDVRLLSSLASYAALAIAHAQAGMRLQAMTVTDDLTGVANRRALMERTREEVERSTRHHHPLAALMIDLDHFKRVNDDLGHLVGDDVLRRVAACLRDGVRRVDMVARYGGEEFVVLLPETGRDDAVLVAEKLRAAVAALDLPHKLTISVGVAMCPEHAVAPPRLIDAADQALLAAKRAGRDRVMVAA